MPENGLPSILPTNETSHEASAALAVAEAAARDSSSDSSGSAEDEGNSDWELGLVRWYFSKRRPKKNPVNSVHTTYTHQPDAEPNGITKQAVDDAGNTKTCEDMSRVEFLVDQSTGRFQCPSCQRLFSSRYLARIHYASVHLQTRYPCAFCGKSFENPRRRHRHHLVAHHRYKDPVECPVDSCHQTFYNPVSRSEHLYHAHRKKGERVPFSCSVCECSDFTKKSSLEKHLLVKHSPRTPDGMFPCVYEHCSWISKNYVCLRRHLRLHKDCSLQFSCDRPGCGSRFFRYQDLVRHRHTAHASNELQCSFCSRIFLTAKRFERHLIRKHGPDAQPVNKSEGAFLCPVPNCGKILTSARNIRQHIIHAHLQLKSYKCALCNARFTSNNAAGYHIKKFHATAENTNHNVWDHVVILYSAALLNTEEAVQRVCTALQAGTLPFDYLHSSGFGLQMHRPEVTAALEKIAQDVTLGTLRLPRQQRRPAPKQTLLASSDHDNFEAANNVRRPKETHLLAALPHQQTNRSLIKSASTSTTLDSCTPKKSELTNADYSLGENVPIDIVGFTPSPTAVLACLHKRKRKKSDRKILPVLLTQNNTMSEPEC